MRVQHKRHLTVCVRSGRGWLVVSRDASGCCSFQEAAYAHALTECSLFVCTGIYSAQCRHHRAARTLQGAARAERGCERVLGAAPIITS